MKKILFVVFSLILTAGVFTSCEQTETFTHYECSANWDPGFTIHWSASEGYSVDPAVCDFIERFNEEPAWDSMRYVNRLYIKNYNFRSADAEAMDFYNRGLAAFKEVEAKYTKLCKELEKQTDMSFTMPVEYKVRRSVIGEPSMSKLLAEYSFVLKCNCD